MEGEAAAAVLQVLVQNLIDHSKKEISLVRGLDKEAAKLAGSLNMIQQFLNDAEMRSVPGGAVKIWLRKLEDVAFDADNVLDELNYHLLSKKVKATKPMKEKVLSCFSSLNHIARPRNMAIKIQEINENLDAINKEATELGLVGRLAVVPIGLPDAVSETDSFTVDPIFIGRDDVKLEIVGILADAIRSDERLISILAIVGMGGLGKTTLTRQVFNRLKEESQFGSHIWVHVSQNFDSITILKKILKELTSSDQVESESRQDILRKIQQALKDKTYLLVLDDTWNQDLPKWEDFINSLLGVTSSKGNAIVITTRNMGVALTVSLLRTHELKGLSVEDCWSIIKEKAFGKEDFPLEFEAIGRKIAERCKGLPLAANVVGGVLRNKSKDKWLSIEQKWLSRDDGDHITKILRLSFDNLSLPSLKKCFAYCSVFPKGCEIWKRDLIEYWMAEGFLEVDASNEMESVGDKFFNILLQNSLLQVGRRDLSGNVCYVMHDLVHDLACSVLGYSNNVDGMSRVRYITHEKGSSPIPKEVAKSLRTLLFEDKICGNMFSDFECLHVLTLERLEIKELPSSIRKLIHLRVLDIMFTGIKYLPDWIGELFHLQTFRAPFYLKELPSTMKYLTKLRHLYIQRQVYLFVEIGRLTCLETLSNFRGGDKNGCKIGELGSLNNLKGAIRIHNLEKVIDKEEAEKANLFQKSKVYELFLSWDTNREGEANDENVLEGLQPHSDLKKLQIEGFKGKRFPSWTLKMAVGNVGQSSLVPLNNLIEITLSNCSECEEIPMLGQLPNLKSLELKGLSNVKSINSSFYGLVNEETRIVFPALEKLVLTKMPKLAEWAQVESVGAGEVKVFPHLQHLEITECEQLTSFPNHFSSRLERLMIRRIGSYKPLENTFQANLTLLTKLSLEGIYDLECLPDTLFDNFPNLSRLEIGKCPNLRELPDGLGTLNSLKVLIIEDCPSLERISDNGVEQSQGNLTSLSRLEICECHALLYLPCEMVGSSLEKLKLVNLSSLKNLPGIIECLPKLPRLTHLEIVGVPEFMTTGFVEIRPPLSLRDLTIDVSMGGSMETVDGILQGCSHSLYELNLKAMEGWENLPESIQHLTALSFLKLENFGMEELPEWLGNLSSLRFLYIYNCKKLSCLPSVNATRRLTQLGWLDIEGCPELRIEKESEAADSQWPNISHIPRIRIDDSDPREVDSKERRRTQRCLISCL